MEIAVAVVGFLIVAAGVAILFESRRLPKKRARFLDRASTPPSEIFTTYYKNQGVAESRFQELWSDAARILKLDPTRLRPSDRFNVELAPVKGHLAEDELVDLEEYYSAECKRMGLPSPPRLQTLGDLIQVLGSSGRSQ
jgi:hypothetical protein